MDTSVIAAQAIGQALDLVYLILSAVVAWAAGEAIAWLQSHRKKSGEDYLNGIAQRVVQSAEITVARNMQTAVDRLRNATDDGKLDRDDAKRLLDETTEDVLNYLGKRAVADAETIMQPDQFRAFVQTAIEAQVAKWKEGKQS